MTSRWRAFGSQVPQPTWHFVFHTLPALKLYDPRMSPIHQLTWANIIIKVNTISQVNTIPRVNTITYLEFGHTTGGGIPFSRSYFDWFEKFLRQSLEVETVLEKLETALVTVEGFVTFHYFLIQSLCN